MLFVWFCFLFLFVWGFFLNPHLLFLFSFSICLLSPYPNSIFHVLLTFVDMSECERLKAKPGFNKPVEYFVYLTHPLTWCPTAQPRAAPFSCLWYVSNSVLLLSALGHRVQPRRSKHREYGPEVALGWSSR